MEGLGLITVILLFVAFFVGLMGVLVEDTSTDMTYKQYSNETNYTNETTSFENIPRDANFMTHFDIILNIDQHFPNIPGTSWFFGGIMFVLIITAVIVIIRGVN